jgi:hypothetical protein
MKSNLFPIWFAHLEKPSDYQQYGHIDISITMGHRPPAGHYQLEKPVPVILTPSYPNPGRITVRFQCNRGEIAEGTTDGCRWYGGRMSYTCDDMRADCPTMKWWRKNFNESQVHSCRSMIEWLTSKATRVAYSVVMSEFVDARNHAAAESYRLFYETGIPGRHESNGCIINAYTHKDATDQEVTAAVTKALRESHHCSDADFAAWVTAGCQWNRSYYHESKLHTPASILEILGHPIAEEVPVPFAAAA